LPEATVLARGRSGVLRKGEHGRKAPGWGINEEPCQEPGTCGLRWSWGVPVCDVIPFSSMVSVFVSINKFMFLISSASVVASCGRVVLGLRVAMLK
jgi:hypothetical protein